MGGFFITNNQSLTTETIINLFLNKGFKKYSVLKVNHLTIYYFNKIFLKTNHIFKNGNDFLIGIGTFFYKNSHGYDALEKIYNDLSLFGINICNEIDGHYNLIIYQQNKLKVISDKTGTYHSYYSQNEKYFYLSSSFLAVIKPLSKLSINMQEILEFIHSEAFYGGKTIFKEVDYIPFGTEIELGEQLIINNYFKLKNNCNYDIEFIYNNIKNRLSFLKNIHLPLSCEMSAGYDTRLVYSILKGLEIPLNLNTNYNTEDKKDSEIAKYIAQKENDKIYFIEKKIIPEKYSILINNSLKNLELSRDILRSAYTTVFFEEKTKCGQLIIGGYGGELFRDVKFKGIENVDKIILKYYFNKKLNYNAQNYITTLRKKILNSFSLTNKSTIKEICEKFYYERMMYWGGSRLSVFNQYTYVYHPLLDYNILYPVFSIPSEEKHNAKFQMNLISKFYPNLAYYNSLYGYNFKWYINKNLIIELHNFLKKTKSFFLKRVKYKQEKFYLKDDFIKNLIDVNNLKLSFLISDNDTLEENQKGRLITIEKIFNLIEKEGKTIEICLE